MSNLQLLLIYAIVNFFIVSFAYKFFGKKGVMIFIAISVIGANIQVNKGVEFEIFGQTLQATMGNVLFGGIFLATDLLSEKYGRKVAKQAVNLSIFANVAFIIVMYVATLFQSILTDDWYVMTNDAINLFFSINGGAVKAVIVGNLVYFVSQSLDVYIYEEIKKRLSSTKWLWLRNNGSTIISQLVDTILVTYGFNFIGIIPSEYVLSIIFTTLVIKYIVALLDTPFLYIMKFIKPNVE